MPLVKGKTITTADEWVKSVSEFASANVLDTTLGGETAKKILSTSPEKTLTVGTIFDNLLWYIEGTSSDPYWSNTQSTIVDSFKFKPTASPTKTKTTVQDNSGGGVDEEEVLE